MAIASSDFRGKQDSDVLYAFWQVCELWSVNADELCLKILEFLQSHKKDKYFSSAPMSKITNDDLTRSGTGCFTAVPI